MQPPPQHKICDDPQADENSSQSAHVDPVIAVAHGELLEKSLGIGEGAVNVVAVQLFPPETVDGDH